MTDKKIMADKTTINSVDVSKCEYLRQSNLIDLKYCVSGNSRYKCEISPHCYYKQLQRKIAECEELKDKLKQAEFTLENKNAQTNIFKRRSKNYFKALNEVEEYCNKYGQNSIGFRKSILDIINKAKDGEE